MTTLLTVQALTKKFGSLTAVNNINFVIEKGNVYGILGPNGSGKSTTLGMLLNVVNPSSGSFSWFKQISTHHALKQVGAIIERPNFYPYMSAYQNLRLVCEIKQIHLDAIDKKLELVGLLDRKDHAFKTFSLGMKQRLAIASALLNDPEVLILDEPTNGLDPQGIFQIRDIITTIAQKGTTILLASHLLDEVEKVCSHVIVLQNGKMKYSGRVDALRSNFGYFELASTDEEKLIQTLKLRPEIGVIRQEKGLVIAPLKEEMDAEQLSHWLFEKKCIITHFVKKFERLESKFLELTQNDNR